MRRDRQSRAFVAARALGRRMTAPGDNGSALVEFALSAMILVTVLFGILDFGRAIYSYHFVSYAAHQAARYALVRGSTCSGLGSACPATATDISNYVLSLAPSGVTKAAITVTSVCGSAPPAGACSSPNNAPGNVVKVTVQYQFPFLFGLVHKGSIPMSGNSQMVIAQ